ncbi:glycosyltransferase [Deinococcus caeni]|uniref:glycosyltransferase n=1 Tax=Deinococcus caeni TaxID=569127 RepID=UPI00361C6529
MESLIREIPSLSQKSIVINNPIDGSMIERQAQKDLIEGIRPRKRVEFLAAGRLEKVKGFDTLINAFSRFGNNDVGLSIIGEGSQRKALESLIKDLNLSESVSLLGFKMNPYVYMKETDVFVLSSLFEGLPTVLIEAQLLGKPIISTDCDSGPREILDNGKFGSLVQTGDSESLFLAMKAAYDDPSELIIKGLEGKVFAEKYNPHSIANNFLLLFKDLVENTKSSRKVM